MKKVCLLLISLILFPIEVFAFNSNATSTIVMSEEGQILYSNNVHEKRLIASITKIMTAIIAIESNMLDDEIVVGQEVLSMYGTSIYLEVGESMKLIDLLYGLMLRSGNDASVVIANHVGGSEEKFVEMMNNKANELGMENTIFSNPHGLDEDTKNYSTAYDMALLTKYAYSNKLYRKISNTLEYEVSTNDKNYLWHNRNEIIGDYKKCTGGKNGYTPSAGKTLVTTSSNSDFDIIVVTLNDGDLYNNHKNLSEYAFNNYSKYKIVDKDNFSVSKEFYEGNIYLEEDFTYLLEEDEVDKINTLVSIKDVNKDVVGVVDVYLSDELIGSVNIKKEKAKKISWFSKIIDWICGKN